jgi:hypothetical protein
VIGLRRAAEPETVREPGGKLDGREEEHGPTPAELLATYADLDDEATAVLTRELGDDEPDETMLRSPVSAVAAETGQSRAAVARDLTAAEARREAFDAFTSERGIPTEPLGDSRRRWIAASEAVELELARIGRQLAALDSNPNTYLTKGPLQQRRRRLRARLELLEEQSDA